MIYKSADEANFAIDQYIASYISAHNISESLIFKIQYKYETEKEYTVRNELLLMNGYYWEWETDWWEGQTDITFLGAISLQDVKIEPLKMLTGCWLWHENYRDYDGYICSIYKCSNCFHKTEERTAYCPECGIKMKKGNENG